MTRLLTFALATIILLSSCANKFSVVKRKYTKGYYVSSIKKLSSNKKELIGKNNVHAQKTTSTPDVTVDTVHSSQETPPREIALVVKEVYQTQNINVKKTIVAEKKLFASASNTLMNLSEGLRVIKPVLFSKMKKNNSGKIENGATFLVLVILCFFWMLNLISVYVHDGHTVTTNFWLTFILNFTYLGGLILSLLILFDIVDLSK